MKYIKAYNPWTAEDEKEHFPSEMEWWAVEAFFKTVENDKNWSLKVAFNEGFRRKKIVGSISNITLFDQDNNIHFKCYSRTLSKKLQSKKDRFYVRYQNSFMKGKFPHYNFYFEDKKNDIQLDFTLDAESYPRWISQDITNGWLPIGLGFYRYGFIPKMNLSGSMKFNGKKYILHGKGYFEHVWGNFDYDNPLILSSTIKNTISTYSKLAKWWLHNRTIKFPKSIQLSTDNNPFGYDWVWGLFDNGWSFFYGNIMFWLIDGPAAGTLIFTKDGQTYKEYGDITFHYLKTKYADDYDFYYPTEYEITAKNGKEKIHLIFKMNCKIREHFSQFIFPTKFWIGLSVCEAPGTVEGYYFDGEEKIQLNGICKIESQRQISIFGHNSVNIRLLLPPRGIGISVKLESHFLKKKLNLNFRLVPSPILRWKFKKIDESKIH
jgi:hypothetical protein